MENILYMAENLKNEVKNGKVYNDYISAKEKIRQNSDLRERVEEFRKKKTEYSAQIIQGGELTLDEEKYISKLYFDLCLNDNINEFFTSEMALIELIVKIQEIISFDPDITIE